ncbi:S1 RNA-binding domain-containing protein [Spirillospora sp. NPDC049024]
MCLSRRTDPASRLGDVAAHAGLRAGNEGLIHLSELADSPVNRPGKAVELDDSVTVVVTDIDAVRLEPSKLDVLRVLGRAGRVKVDLVRAAGSPWPRTPPSRSG